MTMAFQNGAYEIARDFDASGDHQLAEQHYVSALKCEHLCASNGGARIYFLEKG